MDPFGNNNPFGGPGMPGDPMEQVLSLQTYSSDDSEPVPLGFATIDCPNTGTCPDTGTCPNTGICTKTRVC